MMGVGEEEYLYLDQDIEEHDSAPLLSRIAEGGDEFSSEVDIGHATQHLGATILASKFMKKRGNQRMVRRDDAATSLKKLMKPDEPDFSMTNDWLSLRFFYLFCYLFFWGWRVEGLNVD